MKKASPLKLVHRRLGDEPLDVREVSPADLSLSAEAEYIIACAFEGRGRLVTIGPLVFFSTSSGDAWLLEPESGVALPLAQGGDRVPFTIVDTPTTFSIEWTASYRVLKGEFLVREFQSERVRCIAGYPTEAIRRAEQRLGKP